MIPNSYTRVVQNVIGNLLLAVRCDASDLIKHFLAFTTVTTCMKQTTNGSLMCEASESFTSNKVAHLTESDIH
eukprot:6281319-Amphidinium_carterae.1